MCEFIVLIRSPQKFKPFAVKGQLEFTNDSPSSELVKRMEMAGYKSMLLVGGSIISSLFFKENNIDEVWVTLEPYIFGKGKGLVEEDDLTAPLQLKIVKRLNKKRNTPSKIFCYAHDSLGANSNPHPRWNSRWAISYIL